MNDTVREFYQASEEWSAMAERIRDTGTVRPEDVAAIAQALAFLHAHLGYHLHEKETPYARE